MGNCSTLSLVVEKRKILIVEDEPDHLMALKLIFEGEEDLEIYDAHETVKAEKVLDETKIDLMLLDLALPGEDGIEFCRRLRSKPGFDTLPILAISAYPDQFWRDKAIEAGCNDFIGKPFEPSRLIEKVKRFALG